MCNQTGRDPPCQAEEVWVALDGGCTNTLALLQTIGCVSSTHLRIHVVRVRIHIHAPTFFGGVLQPTDPGSSGAWLSLGSVESFPIALLCVLVRTTL